jgi:hypothetical protein
LLQRLVAPAIFRHVGNSPRGRRNGANLTAGGGQERIGHVDDFVIDPDTWGIRHLLIDTTNWIGGRTVLIAPSSVKAVPWHERIVEVAMTRDAVARSAKADRFA